MPDRPARPAEPELLPPEPHAQARPRRVGARADRAVACARAYRVRRDRPRARHGRALRREMGAEFVGDFLAVAADEAMHFALLDRQLARARQPLRRAAGARRAVAGGRSDTRHDVAARLAVVPMVLEARGLDVTPATIERVRAAGRRGAARGSSNESLTTKSAMSRSAPSISRVRAKRAAKTPEDAVDFARAQAFPRGPEASVQRLSAFGSRFVASACAALAC